ncbi:MAG: hypothetical protein APR63_09505 [Desulfuromonas sp. SDB]|nr:MAG: hypothetical protein APR63_09505 [Desulfuromonas sp. SDB]
MAESPRRLSLDDIIADEVAKQVSKQVSHSDGGGGGVDFLGIKDISDITKLLAEISKITQTMSPKTTTMKEIPDSSVPINKEPSLAAPPSKDTITIDIPKLVDNVIEHMPLAIQMYGDLKMSEIHTMLVNDKDSVIELVRGMVK